MLHALLCALLFASTFDLKEGSLTYTVVHKLHEVKGTSRAIEGRAQVQPGGALRVQVRAKLASFDSGNSNRDAHMREATHDAAHPFVQVKGTASGVQVPLSAPQEITLDAIVDLNGQQQKQAVKVRLEPAAGGVRAKFSFPISLDAFKVERPELLFVKVDDRALIDGDLLFTEAAK